MSYILYKQHKQERPDDPETKFLPNPNYPNHFLKYLTSYSYLPYSGLPKRNTKPEYRIHEEHCQE